MPEGPRDQTRQFPRLMLQRLRQVAFPLLCFGLMGLSYWARLLHLDTWLGTLPFAYQTLARIGLILLYLLVPFLVWLYVLGSRKDA